MSVWQDSRGDMKPISSGWGSPSVCPTVASDAWGQGPAGRAWWDTTPSLSARKPKPTESCPVFNREEQTPASRPHYLVLSLVVRAAGVRRGQPGAAPLPPPAQPPGHPEGLLLLPTGPPAQPAPAREGNPLPGRFPGAELCGQPAGLPGELGQGQTLCSAWKSHPTFAEPLSTCVSRV